MVFLEMPSSSLSKAGNWRGSSSGQGMRTPLLRGSLLRLSFPPALRSNPRELKADAGHSRRRRRPAAADRSASLPAAMSTTALAGRRLHFIAIGGAGMSALALVARALGAEVTGSDLAESSYLPRLREAGVEPVIGHSADGVPPGAEVVRAAAVRDDNPELAAARSAGARVLHRADLLAEVLTLGRS